MNWKFKIGDFVTPIVHAYYEHESKLVVTARVTEEWADHTERYYLCSGFKLGDYIRIRAVESELTEWKPKIR
jgi:hypothetical protein